MIYKTALLALITATISLCGNNSSFIAEQKAIILTEEQELVEIYNDAKISAKEALSSQYSTALALIKQAVTLILETPEFSNYTEYMTDFQASLILKGGLTAEELPTVSPDRNLFIAINRIAVQIIGEELLESPEALHLFDICLTLHANRIGTAALLAKLDQA